MALYDDYFYHKTIFKSVATFGTLFNDITVKRKTSDGNTVKELKVPLSYAPRSKFLSKIEESGSSTNMVKTMIEFSVRWIYFLSAGYFITLFI